MDREEYFLDLFEQDQNDPNVQYEIGRCYLQGDGVEPDGAQAEFWLQKAADQGQPDAIALLNVPREDAGMTGAVTAENLLDWCAAAEEGDPEAQYRAALYFREEGGPGAKQDVERYLRMAADQGHPMACTILGEELLEKNPQEAVRHLKNAADCGVPRAMNLLGQCYFKGHGIAKDDAQAQRWFEGAAERGTAEDKLNMALRYRFGEGMPCSPPGP